MKYMGSKSRFAKAIYAKICELSPRNGRAWVEPFAGGMNMICEVPHEDGPRYANDCNEYLIALFKATIAGVEFPEFVTSEERKFIKANPEKYHPWQVGYAGFICGFGGDFNGGFAGKSNTKIGTVRNYQDEGARSLKKQALKLKDVFFCNASYKEIQIPKNSIVYCDPPYHGVTGYGIEFNHCEFWGWVREVSKEHDVFVSEYNAPDDFECVWQCAATSSLSANGKSGGNKQSIEKLFQLRRMNRI
jgi:DNA adenine methylase